MLTYIYNILKRYLFHLRHTWSSSLFFPGNFVQIESEPTENGFLLEKKKTSLIKSYVYFIDYKYLFKRYFITASKAKSEELEVVDLPLSSIFKEKS